MAAIDRNFETELAALLNKHGADAHVQIPDYRLAALIRQHIEQLAMAIGQSIEEGYIRPPSEASLIAGGGYDPYNP